jgi:hypothetical protein
MTRNAPRRALVVAGIAAAVLVTPAAAAQAATYTVAAGGGTCGGADTSCESLNAAAGAAGSGDTVQVAPGTYSESPTFTSSGVTITGSTAPPGVIVTGTITFSGNGSTPSVLEKLIVAPSTAGSPAVGVSGSAGVAVRDTFLLSGAGAGMAIASGTGNEITRSTVVSGAANGHAVDVQASAVPVGLVLSSSILSGGAGGSGLSVRTGVGTLLPGSAAPATVTARHVTIAGSTNAIALDASGAVGLLGVAAGNIAATVTDSIVLGATPRATNPGLAAPLVPPNTASLAFTRTDQTTPADQLFVNAARRNLHLRSDAPAIDKGQLTPGDSATDVDGQPREAGAASDLGADEFGNVPPTAAIAVTTPTPRSTRPVTFDAGGSSDREAGFGGGIAQYQWIFGDGTTQSTTTPTVSHTYAREGAVVVQLVVVDRQGGVSAPAIAPLKIIDGAPPRVVISKPRQNQTIKLTTTTTRTVTRGGAKRTVKTRKPTRIGFAGTASDPSRVTAVYVTLQRLAATAKARAKTSAGKAKPTRCTWLDPKRGLVTRSCVKPVLIRVAVRSGRWAYNVPTRLRLGAGSYRVSAYGTDGTGAFGNSAPKRNRVVRITLRD